MSRRTLDLVLALVLTALVEQQVLSSPADPDERFDDPAVSAPLLAIATMAVAVRRTHPLAAAGAFAGAVALQALVTGDFAASPGLLLTALAVLYAAGAYAPRGRAIGALLAVLASIAVREAQVDGWTELDLWNAAFFWLLLVLAFGAGVAVRSRRSARDLQRRADRQRRAREDHEQAVAEERARIARELHDVVAHAVSASVVQAEAAEEVIARDPERARASLQRIQGAGREALTELRRTLDIMRDGPPPDTTHRTLADLDHLAADARADGLDVVLDLDALDGRVPPGVELSAYRIVQEALTNVRRHAGRPVQARVSVRCTADVLEVRISDDGRGGTPAGGGHGIVGMRERVALFGGSFRAGPVEAGGFVVEARFPLPA